MIQVGNLKSYLESLKKEILTGNANYQKNYYKELKKKNYKETIEQAENKSKVLQNLINSGRKDKNTTTYLD